MPKVALKRSLDTKVDRAIGDNLHAIRRMRKMSQTELADALGVSFQQIQKYEKGMNRLSASTLYKLSKVLKVTIMDFYAGLDNSQEKFTLSDEEISILHLYSSLPSKEMRASVKKMMQVLKR